VSRITRSDRVVENGEEPHRVEFQRGKAIVISTTPEIALEVRVDNRLLVRAEGVSHGDRIVVPADN
jgi:hypothetical protein